MSGVVQIYKSGRRKSVCWFNRNIIKEDVIYGIAVRVTKKKFIPKLIFFIVRQSRQTCCQWQLPEWFRRRLWNWKPHFVTTLTISGSLSAFMIWRDSRLVLHFDYIKSFTTSKNYLHTVKVYDGEDFPDTYVKITVTTHMKIFKTKKTSLIRKSLEPSFNQSFDIKLSENMIGVTFLTLQLKQSRLFAVKGMFKDTL